jgi:hypothetical protein
MTYAVGIGLDAMINIINYKFMSFNESVMLPVVRSSLNFYVDCARSQSWR